jgi:hypothetical protein
LGSGARPRHLNEDCARFRRISNFSGECDATAVYTLTGFQAEMETQAINRGY